MSTGAERRKPPNSRTIWSATESLGRLSPFGRDTGAIAILLAQLFSAVNIFTDMSCISDFNPLQSPV
jgi:hypothetical protein